MLNNKDDMMKTTFRLPKSLLKEVKQYGLDNDKTDTNIFNEALREYLDKRKNKGEEKKNGKN